MKGYGGPIQSHLRRNFILRRNSTTTMYNSLICCYSTMAFCKNSTCTVNILDIYKFCTIDIQVTIIEFFDISSEYVYIPLIPFNMEGYIIIDQMFSFQYLMSIQNKMRLSHLANIYSLFIAN